MSVAGLMVPSGSLAGLMAKHKDGEKQSQGLGRAEQQPHPSLALYPEPLPPTLFLLLLSRKSTISLTHPCSPFTTFSLSRAISLPVLSLCAQPSPSHSYSSPPLSHLTRSALTGRATPTAGMGVSLFSPLPPKPFLWIHSLYTLLVLMMTACDRPRPPPPPPPSTVLLLRAAGSAAADRVWGLGETFRGERFREPTGGVFVPFLAKIL